MTKLYIVVPCYNEEEVLPITSKRLAEKLTELTERGVISPESRVLMVDDGSRDATWRLITELHERDIAFDAKAFRPHITLARRARIPRGQLPELLFPAPAVAPSVTLYKSILDQTGATYKPLYRIEF